MTQIIRPTIKVVEGDITRYSADAIMTCVNSAGLWFGGVDGAIQRVAGGTYHSQLAKQSPLKNLQVVVARGDRRAHPGNFDDIVFVVDDLESPVSDVMYAGLSGTAQFPYSSLSVPAIRMGVMAGLKEKTPREVVSGIKEGLNKFLDECAFRTNLKEITFITYNSPESTARFCEGFGISPERN